ncbi:MAG: AbiU2 domain-containing protein [Limimaricola soesokkakensis]|uniref:AbiU2 domain-containing protein n=1 Tax=Limimaricola soesokkakensis TaxID=1343159 RepID=UPI00405866C2
MSSDDILGKRQEALGGEDGALMRNIENDVYFLRSQWGIYQSLFSTSPDRVELFNEASGIVAFLTEKALFESAILGICRLTDPSSMRGVRNVSIFRLRDFLDKVEDQERFDALCQDLNEKSAFARSWRNKSLAHSDDDIRNGRAKLDVASVSKVSDCLDAIARLLKLVAAVRLGVHLVTRPVLEASNDEIFFLKALYDGVRARSARKERAIEKMKEGKHEEAQEELYYPSWVISRPDENWEVD